MIQVASFAARDGSWTWDHIRVGDWSLAGGVYPKAEAGATCQDAIGYWTDGDRLVAVVADGVSQSFQGDLAARAATVALPSALASTTWDPFPTTTALDAAFTAVRTELERIVGTEGNARLAGMSGMRTRSLQRTRDDDGSQAVMVILLARLREGRGCIVQLGDAWTARSNAGSMVPDVVAREQDVARSRFSSVDGVRGRLHVGQEFELPRTTILASDGADFAWARTVDDGAASRATWESYARQRAPHDDVSFLTLTRQHIADINNSETSSGETVPLGVDELRPPPPGDVRRPKPPNPFALSANAPATNACEPIPTIRDDTLEGSAGTPTLSTTTLHVVATPASVPAFDTSTVLDPGPRIQGPGTPSRVKPEDATDRGPVRPKDRMFERDERLSQAKRRSGIDFRALRLKEGLVVLLIAGAFATGRWSNAPVGGRHAECTPHASGTRPADSPLEARGSGGTPEGADRPAAAKDPQAGPTKRGDDIKSPTPTDVPANGSPSKGEADLKKTSSTKKKLDPSATPSSK